MVDDPRARVAHVAELAALSLDDAEAERLARDMDAIVRYVEELSSVDTEGVEPTTSPIAAVSALREDVEVPSLTHEEALGGAPRRAGSPEVEGFAVPVFVES